MRILSKPKLHIVAFDIPFPPDYGGAIDVFYKVKHLSEAGAEIYLHCPQYSDRKPSIELEQLCQKVWYYPRQTGLSGISVTTPYMVYSRRNANLLQNLIDVEAPILFDGVSTSYYASHTALKNRTKILRNQNIEQDYFAQLAEREGNILKKIYYSVEAMLLRSFENKLSHFAAFFTVALHDHAFFKDKYPAAVHEYIPSFQPYDEVESIEGSSDYALYHGNLRLAENKEAALFLINEVVARTVHRFIIAGRNPGQELFEAVAKHRNCSIVANPSMEEMDKLTANAQVHVLPTFQNTGLKLKLLHALFHGRHVLVNEAMVHGTGLEELCTVAQDGQSISAELGRLMNVPFTKDEVARRNSVLGRFYSNKRNAEKIIRFLQQRHP